MFSLIKCRNGLGKNDQTAILLEDLSEGTKALFGSNHTAVRYIYDGQMLSKDTSDVSNQSTKQMDIISVSEGSDHIRNEQDTSAATLERMRNAMPGSFSNPKMAFCKKG